MSKRSRQAKIEQHQYVGLDVSLAETSIAVVDESGRMLWRGKVDTTPEAIAEALRLHAPLAQRIGPALIMAVPEPQGAWTASDLCRCAPRQGGAVAAPQQD